MPTYDWKCHCGAEQSTYQSIASYSNEATRIVPKCHGDMERKLSVVPGHALGYALAGDRHYEGMRATDGTDISSRTKHREYMRQRGLTTADDFKGEWKQASKERAEYFQGTFKDRELRETISKQVHEAVARPD